MNSQGHKAANSKGQEGQKKATEGFESEDDMENDVDENRETDTGYQQMSGKYQTEERQGRTMGGGD